MACRIIVHASLIISTALFALLTPALATTSVTHMIPDHGSLNGGTRITVYGQGFAENQFNFGGEQHLGNELKLVSATATYVCDIHKDGCTEIQLMCYTRPMPEGDYYIRVFVDGQEIPDNSLCGGPNNARCLLMVRDSQTPKIQNISPRTLLPGAMLSIDGKLFTDLYETSEEQASNGREERMVRSYLGGQTCEIRDALNDVNYNLVLNLDSDQVTVSDYGNLQCKLQGTYVGNQNYSFIVNGMYGRSSPERDVKWVTAQNEIAMVQTYADVWSVTPVTGSVVGGTLLTITGNYFDDTDAPIQVSVAGEPCTLLEQSDTEILCELGAAPVTSSSQYPGNRGVLKMTWNATEHYDLDLQDIPSITDTPLLTEHLEQFSWSETEMDYSVTYTKGYFLPPSDNDYKFYLSANDEAQLWMTDYSNSSDRRLLIECQSSCWSQDDPSQQSERMTLTAGKPYLLEVMHKEHRLDAFVHVGVHVYRTEYVASQAQTVRNDIQGLRTHSIVVLEQQTVTIAGWRTQGNKEEVQVVDVTTDDPSRSVFRLCLYAVCTGPLSGFVSGSELRSELNQLPSISPESVRVTASDITGGKRYTITFNSNRGDWPDFTGVRDPTSLAPVSVSVSSSTSGIPSMKYLVLSFDGVPAPPLAGAAVTASDIKGALTELFSARCPQTITSPMGKKFHQTYEKVTSYLESGTRVTDVEPLCGRVSSLNPEYLYHKTEEMTAINVFNYPYLCFGFNGQLLNKIQLKYEEDKVYWREYEVEFSPDVGWQYQCINLASLISDLHPDFTKVTLLKVHIYRNGTEDLLVDEVYIGSSPPTEDEDFGQYRRLTPKEWIGQEVTVSEAAVGSFDVTLKVYECAHNLPLISVEHSQNSWPSGVEVVVTRSMASSPPIDGTMSLTYNGQTLPAVMAGLEPEELQDQLESLGGVGKLSVAREGDCSGYIWLVEWMTSPGDHPQLEVDGSGLTGNSPTVSVQTVQDGGLHYTEIPADMLYTPHHEPQVVVTINNIPSVCSGNCSFAWDEAATPTISYVTPTSGSSVEGTDLTITGTGFDVTPSNNNVTVGGVACQVTLATTSEIQCAVGDGPAGSHDVIVYVHDKGSARHEGGTKSFTYNFDVSGLTPTDGGLGGGTVITLTGTGFGPFVNVTIGGKNCVIIEPDYDTLTCRTPPATAGSVTVTVTEGSHSMDAPTQFTYDAPLTPTISHISSNLGYVGGGRLITVEGSGFGVNGTDNSVHVANTPASVVSYNDTTITLVLPSVQPGTYQLLISVGSHGNAIESSTGLVPEIEYRLKVTDLTPTSGSLFGGTHLTLTGEGFGTDHENVQISIGNTACDIDTVTNSEVLCTLQSHGNTHLITNQGIHPAYGKGYAWSPLTLEVQVGDIVRWIWTTPDLVQGIAYRVEKTSSPMSTQYAGSGFRSGASNTANGVYEYQFTSSGTYYYWSGTVDTEGLITLRGVVKVTERLSSSQNLTLSVTGHQAAYDNRGAPSRKKRSVGCSEITTDIPGCSESISSSSSSNSFGFDISGCRSPTVSNISPTSGTADTDITISGSGFGSLNCQNEVLIGEHPCVVKSSTSSVLVCNIQTQGNMSVGIPHVVQVSVNNRGSALMDIEDDMDRRFVLLPSVSAVSPSSGSTKGGTLLTVTGAGYVENLSSVQVAGVTCNIQTVTYTEIICETANAWETSDEVVVRVISMGQFVPSECSGACTYSFASSHSPVVTAITPNAITAEGQILTISGTGFSSTSSDNVVFIGVTECIVQSASSSSITCDVGQPIAGAQAFSLKVLNKGYASSDISTVPVTPGNPSLSLSTGSLGGGTSIRISGLGFAPDSSVTIGGSPCDITLLQPTLIECSTPSGSSGAADVIVQSNSVVYGAVQFTYSPSVTAVMSSVSPISGTEGETITIGGSNMATDPSLVTVTVGDSDCSVTAATATSVSCTLGDHAAANVPVTVLVDGWGLATGDVTFTYILEASSISPASGSYGGGQVVTVTGRGFDANQTRVAICGEECQVTDVPSSTEIVCVTPENTGSGSTACDVVVTVANTTQDALSGGYTYDGALTPQIMSVDPRRGGTGGGTTLTISGSGFGTDQNNLAVTIAGTPCPLVNVADNQVTCITDSHKPSVEADVVIRSGLNGIAQKATPDAAAFQYIDVWSSRFTWGNTDPPVEGDMVIIPSDMTVLLDIDTPVLKMILIQGGQLIFDEVDVELNSEIILITDGGLLQVGTEAEPFQHKATLKLHGHVKSKEMPIYGTKCIAVREGTLDLHGKPVTTMWTRLQSTANIGDSEITLETPVEWSVGDQIVIATTGLRHSQSENEQRTITDISVDKKTLTLDLPLNHTHLGQTISLGAGHDLEARAEVGLLTHNVVVRGSDDDQWHDKIEACPDGFDTGEFATQTCFQGRAGEEIGSSQFGAHIIMHAPRHNEELVIGRIENVELTYVGQAFRLGRYAIHFHLNGEMPSSYVRGCSIHNSFNRAVNIHDSHYLTVENNVAYDIMGGAFFLEDGVEIGNVFQYNLAVYVIASTSLQNDDITPAAFWITNANNTVQHNAAAGGTHFGFWYRMKEHPDGPSFDADICPRRVPLAVFQNNTVHSQGWFGIWIFQHFYPMLGGTCDSEIPVPAKFYELVAWNNEKGAEWVGGGAIQFINFKLVHNEVAGVDMKMIQNLHGVEYTDDAPMIAGNVIVSQAWPLSTDATQSGLVMPYGRGLLVRDTTFINFNQTNKSCFMGTNIDGSTGDFNGGYQYGTERLSFVNSDQKILFRWTHDAVYHDFDGTLCGTPDCKVIPDNPILPPACSVTDTAFRVNGDVPGSTCDQSVKFNRFSFNHPVPESLLFKNVTLQSVHGTTYTPFAEKRFTHKEGWMALLPSGEEYIMTFENGGHVSNISYEGMFYDFKDDDHIIMTHNLSRRPDKFVIMEGEERNGSTSPLTFADNINGDWMFDNNAGMLSYIMSSKLANMTTGAVVRQDTKVHLDVYSCFFPDCLPPPDPNSLPPTDQRPDDYIVWHSAASWEGTEEGWGGRYDNGSFGPPLAGDNVKIPEDVWMVVTEPIPTLSMLWVYGVLEFEFAPYSNGSFRNFVLSASHIVISGGRLIVGWENNVFRGNMEISLLGDHFTPELPMTNGPNLGAKALGVFGGLDLHGIPRTTAWVRMATTATPGATTLTLVESVDWQSGDEIVIAPTGFDLEETEVKTLSSVSGDGLTLTFDTPLNFKHQVSTETISPGRTYTMAAEVGLLSRNIKIVGGAYASQPTQAFGARVLVGEYMDVDEIYRGYVRISNVEFSRSGQEGWTDWYDPRFSLSFLNIGDVTDVRPCYVRSCTFHHGYSPAIGVFSTNGVEMSDNVIHHTVGSAMIVKGVGNSLKQNLVVQVVHPGVYNGKAEMRAEWDAGIEALDAGDTLLQGNVVAGSHRALYRVDGEPCSKLDDPGATMWSDNTGHSALTGVAVFPEEGVLPCSLLANFTIYKTFDYGIFTESEASFKVINYLSIDNQLGLFPMVILPSATEHLYEDKFYEVTNSAFIGTSSSFDCDDHLTGINVDLSRQGESWSSPDGGRIGISWPVFSSGDNGAPMDPFSGIMSYQALNGILRLSGITFSQFSTQCGGKTDYIIMANPSGGEDVQHPVEIEQTTLHNVLQENLVHLVRANVGKINPADCVDMECDGQKKALLQDHDGTFLGGAPGFIVPESEWAWDQDPRRGLGDYRIPTTMLTDMDGNRLDVDVIAPYKGIVRDNTCTYIADYQAYRCRGLTYRLLHLESMDSDTETRRVSPVAVLVDRHVDLINGPQDHGWCSGYTCQKRLSTFPLVVATGKSHELYFTGTTPQDTRYHLLNAAAGDSVLLSTWYSQSWRLKIYVNGIYVMPTNAYYTADGQLALSVPSYEGEYVPDIASDPSGSNYFDRATQMLHVVVRGSAPVEVRTDTTVLVSFDIPYMTVDEFFGENIVNNLASFFNIPPHKIKYAEAVRESRRKRSNGLSSFNVEISNPPLNMSDSSPSDLTAAQIRNLSAALINAYQLGQLGQVLNLTILSLNVVEPPPDTSSPEWGLYTLMNVVGDITLKVPSGLGLAVQPEAISEGNHFRIPPQLVMADKSGHFLSQVGSLLDPWEVAASLEHIVGSHGQAQLGGATVVPFLGGVANFSDLSISHSGRYRLRFSVTSPPEAAFDDVVHEVTIDQRQLSGRTVAQPTTVYEHESFDVHVALVDPVTDVVVKNIDWQGHTWTCDTFLHFPDIYPGTLAGETTATLDPGTGLGTFHNLTLGAQAQYILSVRCVSSPAGYDFVFTSPPLLVRSRSYDNPQIDYAASVKLRFQGDYSVIALGSEVHVAAAIHNHLWAKFTNVLFSNFNISEGSILSEFNVSGTEGNVTMNLNDLWDHIGSSMVVKIGPNELVALPEMWVDGQSFYGRDGPPSSGLSAGAIAAITSCTILFILALAALLVWLVVLRPKNKLHASPSSSHADLVAKEKGKRTKHRQTVHITDMEEKYGIVTEVRGIGQMDSPTTSEELGSSASVGTLSKLPEIRVSRSLVSLGSIEESKKAIPPLDAPKWDIVKENVLSTEYLGGRLPRLGLIASPESDLRRSSSSLLHC